MFVDSKFYIDTRYTTILLVNLICKLLITLALDGYYIGLKSIQFKI